MSDFKNRVEAHLINSKSNQKELISSNLHVIGGIIDNLIRHFRYKDQSPKHLQETDERIGLKFSFYIDLSFYGYGQDGNTQLFDENSTRIYASVMFSGCTTWVSTKEEYGGEDEWEMTGSHSSCYFDGWNKPILNHVYQVFNKLIPEGYWDHPEHSVRPVSIFMSPDGVSSFGDKVAIKAQHVVPDNDPFKGYDEVLNVRKHDPEAEKATEPTPVGMTA